MVIFKRKAFGTFQWIWYLLMIFSLKCYRIVTKTKKMSKRYQNYENFWYRLSPTAARVTAIGTKNMPLFDIVMGKIVQKIYKQ